jgi:hypothetical protein
MQKLLTIYLDNTAYAKGKMLAGNYAEKHGLVEEHLQQYIAEGWRISSLYRRGLEDQLLSRVWRRNK